MVWNCETLDPLIPLYLPHLLFYYYHPISQENSLYPDTSENPKNFGETSGKCVGNVWLRRCESARTFIHRCPHQLFYALPPSTYRWRKYLLLSKNRKFRGNLGKLCWKSAGSGSDDVKACAPWSTCCSAGRLLLSLQGAVPVDVVLPVPYFCRPCASFCVSPFPSGFLFYIFGINSWRYGVVSMITPRGYRCLSAIGSISPNTPAFLPAR